MSLCASHDARCLPVLSSLTVVQDARRTYGAAGAHDAELWLRPGREKLTTPHPRRPRGVWYVTPNPASVLADVRRRAMRHVPPAPRNHLQRAR